MTDPGPPDPRSLISDILLLLAFGTGRLNFTDAPMEYIVATDAGLIGLAAGPSSALCLVGTADSGPGPDDLVVFVGIGQELETVFLALAKVSGEAELLRLEDGPWIATVQELGRAARGDVAPEAGWFAPTSNAVH
jgi:hypothetical protein